MAAFITKLTARRIHLTAFLACEFNLFSTLIAELGSLRILKLTLWALHLR